MSFAKKEGIECVSIRNLESLYMLVLAHCAAQPLPQGIVSQPLPQGIITARATDSQPAPEDPPEDRVSKLAPEESKFSKPVPWARTSLPFTSSTKVQ